MKRAGDELVSRSTNKHPRKTVTWNLLSDDNNSNSNSSNSNTAATTIALDHRYYSSSSREGMMSSNSTASSSVMASPSNNSTPTGGGGAPPTPSSSSRHSSSAAGHFTFDFMDDSVSSNSRYSASALSAAGGGSSMMKKSPRMLSSATTPTSSRRNERLDSRYSSRLVSPSSVSRMHHQGNNGVGGYYYSDISRNLFDAPGGGAAAISGGSECSMSIDDPSTPQRNINVNNNNNTNNTSSLTSPPNSIRSNSSSTPTSSSSWTRISTTPSRQSVSSFTTATATTATTPANSFLSSSNYSPRKRTSHITGVAYSPMSDCAQITSVLAATSLASSPHSSSSVVSPSRAAAGAYSRSSSTSSAGTTATSPSSSPRHHYRGGSSSSSTSTTDRFIPSRVSSNLNFTLKTGTGRKNPIVRSIGTNGGGGGERRGGGSDGGSSGGSGGGRGGDGDSNDVIPSAESFGATLVGGTPVVVEEAAAAAAAAAAGGADADVNPTFSADDGTDQDSSERQDYLVHRQPLLYDALLRSEMLGENIDPAARHSIHSGVGMSNYSTAHHGTGPLSPFRERSNNLRFVSPHHAAAMAMNAPITQDYEGGGLRRESEHQSIVGSFNLSPVSSMGRQRTPRFTDRIKRKIAKVPTKVLDAPSLQDDFYLNLVDWSSTNVLAVGLGSCVYLWSAATSKVTQLCDLSQTEDVVTSVAWSEGGRHLAVGSSRGEVQLWDASTQKLVRTMGGHSARIGALSWKQSSSGGSPAAGNNSLLASGSRDRLIHLRDPRSDSPYEMRLCAHKQEVCGLKWSFDERSMLASGGNDNKLLVWDIKKHTSPVHSFGEHTAAVKAITWSPHQHGLLASGGGTADRCIRFWNCLTGHGINCIDTGSQVCNLAWSKNCNEIVSTHGYSLNQIVVWKYPSMQKIATLTGHTYRVLYLAVSPDGSTIVTGAGDETLRFWQVFPGPQKENKAGGLLFPAGMPGSVIR